MEYTVLIVLLPMLTFFVLGLLGKRLGPCASGLVGTLSMGVTAALSYATAWQYFTTAKIDGVYQKLVPLNFEWLRFTDKLHIDLGVLLDPISVMMLVVISTVSLMVHIYSMGYMKGERGFSAITPSCRCSASRCSGWSWLPTFSRCISSGSWWAFRPTC